MSWNTAHKPNRKVIQFQYQPLTEETPNFRLKTIQKLRRHRGESLESATNRLKRTISWVFDNDPYARSKSLETFEYKSKQLVCPAVWQLVMQARQTNPLPNNLIDMNTKERELIRQERSYLKSIFRPYHEELKFIFYRDFQKKTCKHSNIKNKIASLNCYWCFDTLALAAKRQFDQQFYLQKSFIDVKIFYRNYSQQFFYKIENAKVENDQFLLEAIIEPKTIVNGVFSDEILDLPETLIENSDIEQESRKPTENETNLESENVYRRDIFSKDILDLTEPPLEISEISQEIRNPTKDETNLNSESVYNQDNDQKISINFILQYFGNFTMVILLFKMLYYIRTSKTYFTSMILIGILTMANLIQGSTAEEFPLTDTEPTTKNNFPIPFIWIFITITVFDITRLAFTKVWENTGNLKMALLQKANHSSTHFKPTKLFLILILTGFNSTMATSLTSMSNGILFYHRGETLLNPTTIKSIKSYRPCDALIFDDLLAKNVKYHSAACNVKIMDDFDNAIVKNWTKNFILLKQKVPLPVAKKICKDLGSSIVTVKNQNQAQLLYSFMSQHNIHRIFAGITNYHDILEPIFDDDSSLATNVYFNTLFDSNDQKNRSWDEVLQKLDEPNPYYHRNSYYEFRRRANLELGVWWESHNGREWKEFGISRNLWTICHRPESSAKAQEAIQTWLNDCSERQEYLKKASELVHRKVQEILPSSIPPSNPKRLDNTIYFSKSLHGMNPSNNDIPDLRQENNNNFKKILRQDTIPLDKQCKQLLDTYKTDISNQTDRHERGIPMAAFSVAFSLFAFAIERSLAQPTMFAGYNNNPKIPDPVIPWMLENSMLNKELDTSMIFTSATSHEQKIYATSEKIITYVNGLHEHLTKIVYSSDYVANANDYISNSDYNLFAQEVKTKYEVSIPNNKKQLKTQVIVSDNSYMIIFIIPINIKKFHHDLYEIIPLGRFNNHMKFYPNLGATKYIAVSTTGTQTYTILDQNELTKCNAEPFCVVKNPSHAAYTPTCGICSFYGKSECCEYTQATDTKPDFKTIQNKTFYSIDNMKSITLDVSCFSTKTRGVGNKNRIKIEGSGYFGLELGCEASWQDILIRSAETEFFEPIESQKEVLTNYPDTIQKGLLKDIKFDIKTLTSQKLAEKYLIPMLIIVGIMAILIFIIFPIACAGKTILGCLRRNPAKEIAKLDKHTLNKPKNEQKETKKPRQKHKEEKIEMHTEHGPIPTPRDKRININKVRHENESASKTKKRTSHEIELNQVERNSDTLTKERIFQAINSLGQKE